MTNSISSLPLETTSHTSTSKAQTGMSFRRPAWSLPQTIKYSTFCILDKAT
jgi:hypothetical protein